MIDDHFQDVYRFALSLCHRTEIAEDLAQEAMLRCVDKRSKSNSNADVSKTDGNKKTSFENHPNELRKWLFRVTFNLWIDQKRKMNRTKVEPVETDTIADLRVIDPGEDAVAREEIENTFSMIARLPETQRQVLYLRTVAGFGIDEVAATLAISRASVKSNLSIARKKLREMAFKKKTPPLKIEDSNGEVLLSES